MRKYRVELYENKKKDFNDIFKLNHLRYALFPNDNAVTSSIIQGWQYEPYMFDFLKVNMIDTIGKDIADIGANNGNFAIDFAHLVGEQGRVFCFEPQRIIYYQLCCNIFMNGLSNVYAHNMAIGTESGYVYMETPDYFEEGAVNFGDVKVGDVIENNEKVKIEALDSFDFKDLVFIKIDVQGYESFVIDGANHTINKHRPYLFVEFEEHLLREVGSSEQLLKTKIEELGYTVKRFQEGIPYQTQSGKCLDCVCIPNEKEPLKHKIP